MPKVRRPAKTDRPKPIIADGPSPALSAIIEKGRAKAREKGHNLVPWKMDVHDGELRCTACRRLLYVAETPVPGGPNYGGPALEEACG